MSIPIIVGTAGWSYKDWEGVVYPKGQKERLGYLARYLDHVEINTTFYHPPAERASAQWALAVADNPGFTFSAKAWRRFTHETDRPYQRDERDRFKESLLPLAESGRLVSLLFQFPHYFRNSPEHRALLRRLADDFREDFSLVLELRSRSWQHPELMLGLGRLGYSVAVVDMPLADDSFERADGVTVENSC